MTGSQTLGHPREILSISVIVDQSGPSLGTTKRLFSEVEYPDTAVYIRDSVLCSWLIENQASIKVNYLYVRTSPLERQFHAGSKYDLKKKNPIQQWKALKFRLQISGELTRQIVKLYGISWPKFKTCTEKSTDPSNVGTPRETIFARCEDLAVGQTRKLRGTAVQL